MFPTSLLRLTSHSFAIPFSTIIHPPIFGHGIEIKQYLRANALPFDESWTFIKTFCCRNSNRTLGLIHINKETGDFACSKCSTAGSWKDFETKWQHYQLRTSCPKIPTPLIALSDEERQVWTQAEVIQKGKSEQVEAILSRYGFNEEISISLSTLQTYGIRIYQDQLIVPLYTAPVYDLNRSLVKLFILDPNQPPTNLTIPFGLNILTGRNTEIILVDSIWDALCIYEMTGKVAIAIPKMEFSIRMMIFFENLRKIHIWYSKDQVYAIQLANLFNLHRCFMITYPQSPFEAYKTGQNLKQIFHESFALINKYIEQFDSFREVIKNELLRGTHYAGTQWQRFPMLTQILKGHRAGELTVLTGSTGCGKTTFLSEYALDLCAQGISTLFGSFEIQTHLLAKVMLTQYSGLNLTKHMDIFDKFADRFSRLPMYFMTFHGQETIDKVISTMGNAVAIHNIQHVIIDNLQFMMGMDYSNDDRFFKQDTLIHRFRNFATNNRCHVTIVIHPRKEEDEQGLSISSIFGSPKASQESDNVLIIQQKKLSNTTIKYLQIVKNRFDGQLGRFILRFDKERLSFSRIYSVKDQSNDFETQSLTFQQ